MTAHRVMIKIIVMSELYMHFICQDDDQNLIYIPKSPLDHDMRQNVRLSGETVLRPNLAPQNFRLFVQSKGSGKRHVSPDSYILYKVCASQAIYPSCMHSYQRICS